MASSVFPFPAPPDIIFEGVALGLGYNQSFTAPGVDQIENFPLVSEVMNPPSNGAAGENGKAGKILKELEALNDYIHPQLSADFGAIGVKLNAFQMIDAFALLVFAGGSHFELDLLGMAQMSFPLDESAVSPLAFIDLAMEAVIDPSAGYFKLAAQLTTQSYIFDKECHITGGMAFYMWYGGENAGDFALTLGGYSPRFNVPAHYPHAPRLGLNWQVYEHLQIRGGAYFAFCPHALMAGGDISAEFHEGDAYASFDFNLDILINWKPFHYDIYTGIDVKAGYGIFGPYEFHLGLHIWGPEFSGTLTIDVPLHSFTIGFGAASPQQPQPIDYSEFKKSFLPSDDKICTVTVNKGLVKQIPQSDETLIVVNPKTLCLKTHSLIPSKTATIGGTPQTLDNPNTSFGIAPMDLCSTKLETSHKITVTREGGSNVENVENDFEFSPVYQNLAKGMWGTQMSCELNESPLIDNVLSGFKITPKNPVTPGTSHDIDASKLEFDDLGEAKYQWESIQSYKTIEPKCSESELLAALGMS